MRQVLSFVIGATVVGIAALAGCKSDDDNGGSTSSSSSSSGGVTTLEEDLAKGICDKTVQCYPALAKLAFGDAAGCVARVAPQFKKSLAAPGNQINATNAKACIDAFKLAACGTDPGELPACNIPGTLPNGTACGADSQCASNSCYTIGTDACGTCQPRAADLGPCGCRIFKFN